MGRKQNKKNKNENRNDSKKKKEQKKSKKKPTWKKGQKMASLDVRVWRRKKYWQWPDLTENERKDVIDQHPITANGRRKQIARMQKVRKLGLGWEYIYEKRGGYKLLTDEMAAAIEFYKENRSKYGNWGGFNGDFGQLLSKHLIKKFKKKKKWYYWSNKRKLNGVRIINSLIPYLDLVIRNVLKISPESKATDFEWNTV